MPDPLTPPVALRAEREKTIKRLIDQYAADNLEVAEFEQRLDAAHRALTVADLQRLTADLPAAAPAATPAAAEQAAAQPARASGSLVQRAHQTMIAIMSGVIRRGRWAPAQNSLVIAVMGGAELDFRQAQLGPGETVIRAVAFMGGVSIIVPPELEVNVEGIGFMGGFDHRGNLPAEAVPAAPRLRVTGLAVMGGVDVRVRAVGEQGDPGRGMHGELRRQRHELRHQLRARRRELRRGLDRPGDGGQGDA